MFYIDLINGCMLLSALYIEINRDLMPVEGDERVPQGSAVRGKSEGAK